MSGAINLWHALNGVERRRGFADRFATLIRAGSKPVGAASYAAPTGAVYVSTAGNDTTGNGTISTPYRTAQKAINTAASGSTIVMRAGTYHESLTTPNGKVLTLQAYPLEAVWFDGSSVVSTWTSNGNGTWSADYAPTYSRTLNSGSIGSYPGAATRLLVDQLWLNETQLVQIADGTTPAAGQFSVNQTTHKVTIGSDPTSKTVQVSDLRQFLVASGRIDLKGLGIRRYAPDQIEFLNAMMYLGGSTAGMLVENCVFSESSMAGWSITTQNCTVRSVTVQDCGYTGGLFTSADGLTIDRCLFRRLNRGGWSAEPATAGIKGTRTDLLTITNNYVTDAPGAYGIWLDVSCIRFTIANNYVNGTGSSRLAVGIEVEEADGGTIGGTLYKAYVVGNTVTQCGIGLKALAAGNIEFWNNDTRGNDIGIYSQQDRAQNDGSNSANRTNAVCPWHTVNNTYCNNVLDVTGGPVTYQIQFLAYDDGPKVDKGWAQIAKFSGNRLHTSGLVVSLGTLSSTRVNFNTLSALAASGSDVGGPPGSKLGTNYQGADTGTPTSYAEAIPAAVAALLGVTTNTKQVGPSPALIPVLQET